MQRSPCRPRICIEMYLFDLALLFWLLAHFKKYMPCPSYLHLYRDVVVLTCIFVWVDETFPPKKSPRSALHLYRDEVVRPCIIMLIAGAFQNTKIIGLAFVSRWSCSALHSCFGCRGLSKKKTYRSCICIEMGLFGLAFLIWLPWHFFFLKKKGRLICLACVSKCNCSVLHYWFDWRGIAKKKRLPIGLAFVSRSRCSALNPRLNCQGISRNNLLIGLGCVSRCNCSTLHSCLGCRGISKQKEKVCLSALHLYRDVIVRPCNLVWLSGHVLSFCISLAFALWYCSTLHYWLDCRGIHNIKSSSHCLACVSRCFSALHACFQWQGISPKNEKSSYWSCICVEM